MTRIGYLYSILREGNLLENVEKAISWHHSALVVVSPESTPVLWARVHNNLGVAYADRLAGEAAENLERSLEHYTTALSKCPRTDILWGEIQFNVAKTWCERKRGDHAANIENGIESLQQALGVRTRERSPELWANTQQFLGNAYGMRVDGDPVVNRQLAIQCYEAALDVITPETSPEKWASLQLNLGVAYIDEKAHPGALTKDYLRGIEHLENALRVTDSKSRPYVWASTLMNLGTAYSEWEEKDGTGQKEKAVECFRQAAQVFTRDGYPTECRKLHIKLGHALYDLRRFPDSRAAFEEAHAANEALRSQWQRPAARKELAAANTAMYRKLVHCCLLGNDIENALYFATAAKSRALLDSLNAPGQSLERLLESNAALRKDWQRIVDERSRLDSLSMRYERATTGSAREQLGGEMQQQRRIVSGLLDEALFNYPQLSTREAARLFSPAELRQVSGEHGDLTMIEYYRHENGWCAFVLSASQLAHVDLPGADDAMIERLARWAVRYGHDPTIGDEKLTHDVFFLLYEYFVRPLLPGLPPEGCLVVSPFEALHLLPLHAALEAGSGRCLWEDYYISYIPGLQALRLLQEQKKRRRSMGDQPATAALLSVAYTAADLGIGLGHVLDEADAIRPYFAAPPRSVYLDEDVASPDEVLDVCREKDFRTLHFGCHGSFSFADAEHSGLLLSGGWLTINRIQTELRLQQYPLVVLSACETGRSFQEGGDNPIGLIQSFLTAGAGSVIASLWTVHDEATRHLFTTFYSKRQGEGLSAAAALREAMQAVRSQPGWKDPFYWAAFRMSGLPEDL